METVEETTQNETIVEEVIDVSEKESDKTQLTEYISDLEQRLKYKTELRLQNTTCVRPPESHFSKLDSGLKKNTAFVKKLKSFTAGQLDALLKDITALNLTKYISEVATAITESKLKMSDIAAAVRLCSVLHQNYSEFSQNFFEDWHKILTFKVSDKIANSSKLRVDLRFYGELVACGIFSNKVGLPLLGNVLTVLINMDKEEHNNIPILLSFCKHCGEDYAGLVPRKVQDLSKVNIVP
jgi:regulator of nonsense transcripts 2